MLLFICFLIIIFLIFWWYKSRAKKTEEIIFNGIPSYIKATDYSENHVRRLDEMMAVNHQAINNEIEKLIFNNNSLISQEEQWYPLWLQYQGKKSSALDKLPILANILNSIPDIEGSYISFFPPGATISSNKKSYQALYKYQYMLAGQDNDLGLNIDGHNAVWKLGQGFVWDETKPYAVWNNSNQTRVVLCISFSRKIKSLTDIQNYLHYCYGKMFQSNPMI